MDRRVTKKANDPNYFWYKRYKTHTKNPLLKKSKKTKYHQKPAREILTIKK